MRPSASLASLSGPVVPLLTKTVSEFRVGGNGWLGITMKLVERSRGES